MANFKVGSGSVCQAAKQSVWGTSVAPTVLLNMTSESLTTSYQKGDEGNLIANKTAAQKDLLAVVTEGGVSMILRPEFIDWLLECGMGKKASNVYTLQDPNTELPISTIVLNRGGIVKTYPDVTIRSLTIEAPAQDYVRTDIDVVGTKEIAAGGTGAQTIQNLSFSKPSYRCTQATLYYGAGGTAASSLASTLCVENCSITIDNGVEDSPATYCSGLFNDRPVPGQRTVSVSFSIPYSDAVDTFRTTYYANEQSLTVALKLVFTTSDANEKVEVYIPNLSLTSGDGNVGGPGIIDTSFAGEALSVGSAEPITITVTHPSNN